MAFQKKDKVEKEVEAIDETVNEVLDTPAPEVKVPEVKAPEVKLPEVKVAESKIVKIRPNFTGKKFVGNTWYSFVKGEVTSVPVNVKDILSDQNALDFL